MFSEFYKGALALDADHAHFVFNRYDVLNSDDVLFGVIPMVFNCVYTPMKLNSCGV